MSPNQANQPSEKALEKVHALLAKFELKYGVTITNEPVKQSNKGA